MRRLGLTAAAVLAVAAAAAGQTVKYEIGGVDIRPWLRDPTISAAVFQTYADIAKLLEDIGPTAKSLGARGEYAAARKKYEELLAQTKEVFTDDSPMVANAYGAVAAAASLAGDTEKTREYSKLAYEVSAKAFPPGTTFPDGRKAVAMNASNYASILDGLGQGEEAEKLLRSAIGIWREVHGKESDHPDVVRTLGNLAHWHFNRKNLDDAEKYAAEALERATRLCGTPAALREHGEHLARSQNGVAEVLRARGRTAEALALEQQAVALSRTSPTTAPDALALRVRNEGMNHLDRGDYPTALAKFREAEQKYEGVFPARDYPNGHPDLLRVRRDIAVALDLAGKPDEAWPLHDKAVEMALALYPAERFPDGHVELAYALTNAGGNRLRRRKADEAARLFRFALDMWLPHIDRQASGLAEADVLNLLDAVPGVLHGLLAAGADAAFDDRDYRYVWASKAGAMRVLDARRRAELIRGNSATRTIADRLAGVRAKLAVELTSAGGTKAAELTRERDELQRQLADELKLPPPARTTPADLRAKLPDDAALVDFCKCGNPIGGEAEYVAFVVTRGAVERVRLGSAEQVERALAEWLKRIEEKADEIAERSAAEGVAALVWKPLADAIPGGVNRVFLSPDADLARIPFAALPASRDQMVLDKFELASVPHGPFLLDLLSREPAAPKSAGELLLVGGVDYTGSGLPNLEFSGTERDAIRAVWKGPHVSVLSEGEPTVARVLGELPKAGAAHFATHAVFDDPTADTAGYTLLDRRHARPSADSPTPLAVRSPLALTAVVLGGTTRADRHLSGEAVAGLRLEGLRFVVLSACQSARGVSARGEGVFGFQRAFHLAGCPCAVGSLWIVSDPATATLMEHLYTRLAAGASVPAALRHAMLTVRDDPKIGMGGGRNRGTPATASEVPGGVRPSAPGGTANTTRLWAAFVTSGW